MALADIILRLAKLTEKLARALFDVYDVSTMHSEYCINDDTVLYDRSFFGLSFR
jgi:hypothetical protein